jgi:hypothetical protein
MRTVRHRQVEGGSGLIRRYTRFKPDPQSPKRGNFNSQESRGVHRLPLPMNTVLCLQHAGQR